MSTKETIVRIVANMLLMAPLCVVAFFYGCTLPAITDTIVDKICY